MEPRRVYTDTRPHHLSASLKHTITLVLALDDAIQSVYAFSFTAAAFHAAMRPHKMPLLLTALHHLRQELPPVIFI